MANKIKAIVVTVSDTRTESEDVSGVTLVGLLLANEAEIVDKIIVSDDFEDLRNTLYSLTERDDANLIITTGGTGFAPRDNTPEATRAVIERRSKRFSGSNACRNFEKYAVCDAFARSLRHSRQNFDRKSARFAERCQRMFRCYKRCSATRR